MSLVTQGFGSPRRGSIVSSGLGIFVLVPDVPVDLDRPLLGMLPFPASDLTQDDVDLRAIGHTQLVDGTPPDVTDRQISSTIPTGSPGDTLVADKVGPKTVLPGEIGAPATVPIRKATDARTYPDRKK